MKKKENQRASRKVDAGTCCVNRKPVNGNIVYASQRQDLLLQPFDLVILNILIRVFHKCHFVKKKSIPSTHPSRVYINQT